MSLLPKRPAHTVLRYPGSAPVTCASKTGRLADYLAKRNAWGRQGDYPRSRRTFQSLAHLCPHFGHSRTPE